MTDARLPAHWVIEEWVPLGSALGGKGYWKEPFNGRFTSRTAAVATFQRLNADGRNVRVVETCRDSLFFPDLCWPPCVLLRSGDRLGARDRLS